MKIITPSIRTWGTGKCIAICTCTYNYTQMQGELAINIESEILSKTGDLNTILTTMVQTKPLTIHVSLVTSIAEL